MTDEIEIRLPKEEGADQWFSLTPAYQCTAEGRVLVGGTLRDISEQKAYQANADRFNARKNAALEILSHDLSGSFALVQQIADFLRQEVPVPVESRVPELLRVLETTSRNSRKMIRDLVAVEFLSSANTDLKRDRVEVGAVLREPLDQLQQGQALLGYRFTYSLPPEPVYANLDVHKFTQVLTNLISNAFKFTPDGGQVNVAIEACPGCVRIQVQDSGIGIPAALLPRLFERFTPARRPGLRGEPTNGLGLLLCQTIVEWHQGTISVVSAEGEGTTFTVDIPQA
jgi:two-component system sensor histidine kinase VicK